MEQNIKIYISCHKECFVPKHPLLFPVQVGTELESKRFNGRLYDNTGDNISSLNRRYCELTAQYWAWKNQEASYYGFFHYRRYLSFADESNIPYKIFTKPDKQCLEKMRYDHDYMIKFINLYDVIVPLPENMYVTAFEHYQQSKDHHIEDLHVVKDIINECYPEFMKAADEYLYSTKLYFGNIFIMKKELFNHYCEWLFTILKKFDRKTDFSKYSKSGLRVNGYLGERLLGIYITWLKQQPNILIGNLPRAHFLSFPGETDNFKQMKLINYFLPPGSRRRSKVKKIIKYFK